MDYAVVHAKGVPLWINIFLSGLTLPTLILLLSPSFFKAFAGFLSSIPGCFSSDAVAAGLICARLHSGWCF
ncbi:MAG: hypothetical protein LUD50_03565 [Clostridia bacterium]|nr:hypothetical protein [Clostridia bacterium]